MNCFSNVARVTFACFALAATSACLGSGGGGGGGGAAAAGVAGATASAFADYDAAYADATANRLGNAPTGNMPTSGSASFAGQFQTGAIQRQSGGKVADAMMGDIAMAVKFGAGSTGSVTSTIDNMLAKSGSRVVPVTGTLKSNSSTQNVVAVTTQSVNVPGRGTQTVRSGSVVSGAAGAVKSDLAGLAGDMNVTLQGSFTGSGAKGTIGTATVLVDTGTVGKGLAGSGTHYTKRQ